MDTTIKEEVKVEDVIPTTSTTSTNTTTTNSDVAHKVLKQVEYYFSDSNFPRDKFLKLEAAKNPEGYVDIDIIAKFNRMKEITLDLQLISETLKTSERLQVSDDGKRVRRTYPLPDDEEHGKKVLYSKGWPENTTIDMVKSFFAPFGTVTSVRLRRRPVSKDFKGSLLCDFETEEIVNKIIADAPKLNETELIYQTFKQFDTEKKEQEKAKFLERKKKREEEGGASGEKGQKRKSEKQDVEVEAEVEEEVKQPQEAILPGCILTFNGIGEGMHRNDVRQAFEPYGKVVHVNHQHGQECGLVRFETPEMATNALTKFVEDKTEIGGKVPTLELLSGEAEQEELKAIEEARASAGRGGRGGRGRGRGGRGRGGNRGGNRGGRNSKKSKNDD